MRERILRPMALLCCLLLVTAHAARAEDPEAPQDLGIPRLDSFQRAFITVDGTPEVRSHKKFRGTADEMAGQLETLLRDARVFEEVSDDVPDDLSESDLRISLHVDTFKYTGAGRYVGGIAAGKAKLGMDVTLTSGGGTEVAAFRLSAKSKRRHGAFGTTTIIQRGRMTEQIAQAVIEQKRAP